MYVIPNTKQGNKQTNILVFLMKFDKHKKRGVHKAKEKRKLLVH